MTASLPADSEAIQRAFSETSDPAAYVPRDASEGALAAIRRWGDSDGAGSSVAALIGTPGLGKTMILRVTEARVHPGAEDGAPRALYVPYASLELEDLVRLCYGLIGRTLPEAAKEAAEFEDVASHVEMWMETLLALGGGPRDPFYVLLDDADAMPAETVEALLTWLPRHDSPVRILLGLNPDSKATRLLAALHSVQPTEIRFRARLTVEETAAYLRTRARRAGVSLAEVEQIDEEQVHRIHSLAGGIPRHVHRLALALFEGAESALHAELSGKREREDWMGSPMEEDPAEVAFDTGSAEDPPGDVD